jgi:hypothetical protein
MDRKQWEKSANGRGLQEVELLMAGFEEMNDVRLEISFSLGNGRGGYHLFGKVTAWDRTTDAPDQPILGSQSVQCSATNLTTVEAVAIHLLYMLDGYLARKEMRGDTNG